MLERIWKRVKIHIPKEQSAYQPGRGTTEQLLAVKILCEKAITTSNFPLYLQLIDMSKAFDTVNRKLLFKNLETILGQDEMHILSILTNRPNISIKLGQEKGELFKTYQGIMQGDCLSAVLFIYYFAMSLFQLDQCELCEKYKTPDINCAVEKHPTIIQKKNDEIITIQPKNIDPNLLCSEHITTETTTFEINPTYADDRTQATTNKNRIESSYKTTIMKLDTYNLSCNNDKTERYDVPRPRPLEINKEKLCWSDLDWIIPIHIPENNKTPNWEKCKLLGSLLETENDIQRRKGLLIDSMNQTTAIFKSKHISNTLKIKTFNMYNAVVFLYNSETMVIE